MASAAYTQCPPVGRDTGCQFLVTITDTGPTVAHDMTQPPYEGIADSLVGVQNNSSRKVQSISLAASSGLLFNFDGDGLCNNASGPAPAGCLPPPGSTASCNPSTANTNHCSFAPPPGEPSGYTEPNATDYTEESSKTPVPSPWPNGDLQNGYEGPRTWFSGVSRDFNSGVVNFSPPLAPGEATYFSVEQPNSAVTAVVNVPTLATSIRTLLRGAGQSATTLTVPAGMPVTDTAFLSGTKAAMAGGKVSYGVFRDKACTVGAAARSSETVTNGKAAPSAPLRLGAGRYYLQASYGGDPVNSPSAATCGAERLVVAHRFNAGLPASRACVRSSLRFNLRRPTRVRSLSERIDINNRVIRRIRVAGSRRPRVTIRRLPKGSFTVSVIGTTARGVAYEQLRTLHRCGR